MTRRRLELLDTSVVLELLRVPYESDRYDETRAGLDARRATGTEFQLPVAAILEAGAHVGRINNGHHRRDCAGRLRDMVARTIRKEIPWSFTALRWDPALVQMLFETKTPHVQPLHDYLSTQQLEMGDALIVAEYRRVRANLNRKVYDVDVWTYDSGLRAVIDSLRA